MAKRHVVVFMVGFLLFLPSLRVGFLLDDYYYLGAIEGRFPEFDTTRSLFPFFINDERATAQMAAEGRYPWWIDERVQGETFRPLSDLLLRLDHAFHGRKALGYHLHSLAWWAAVLLVTCVLYRRVLPGAVGTVAFLLFAIDEAHTMPVSWIANRNALVSLAPMLLSLWAWIRWCEDRWAPGRLIAPLGAVVGLAAGELALAVLGYFVAYAWLGAPSSALRARAVRMAPVLVLAAVYAGVYRALGYGNAGSGVYHHPLMDPTGYARLALTGIPTLLAGGIAGFSADFWYVNPALRTAQVVVGCGAALALGGLLRACWAELDPASRDGLRWLLAGSALSLIPVAAVFPSDRMLLVPGIGILAAVSAVLVQAARSWRTRRRRLVITAGAYLALVHLVLAPPLAVYVQAALVRSARESLALARSPVVAGAGGRETILVCAPDAVVGIYLPLLIDHVGGVAPQSWRPLSLAPCTHVVRRTGDRTLELSVPPGEAMLRSVFEELYRDVRNPLAPGTVLERGLLSAEILEANARGPTRVAFRFARDLSDTSLRFLIWQDGELRVATLPEPGEDLVVARTRGPGGF